MTAYIDLTTVPELSYSELRKFVRSLVKSGIQKLPAPSPLNNKSYVICVDQPTLNALRSVTRDSVDTPEPAFVPAQNYASDVPKFLPNEVGAIHELRILLSPNSQEYVPGIHYISLVDSLDDLNSSTIHLLTRILT